MNAAPPNPYADLPSEPEISIYDIVQFLKKNRRNLMIGLVAGLILGGIGGKGLSKERAVITLDNASSTSAASSSLASISYTDWNVLTSALPYMAAGVQESLKREGKEHPEDGYLSQSAWWEKNVKPAFAYDKNTAKELGAVPDGIKGEYGRILRITVQAEARNEPEAYRRADGAVRMLRNAAIYLRLQSLLVGYRVQAIQTDQTTASLLVQNTIDQGYLQKDLNTLKDLIAFNTKEINARVASINKVINDTNAVEGAGRNIFNIRGGETPEIPLDAKLNEIKLNLHGKEIERLKAKDLLTQNQILQAFLSEAEPLLNGHTLLMAPELLEKLLQREQILREKTSADDFVEVAKLNQIRSDLLGIQLTFLNQLSEVSRSTEAVNRTFVGILGGGFGGLFLALLSAWLLGLYQQSEREETDATGSP